MTIQSGTTPQSFINTVKAEIDARPTRAETTIGYSETYNAAIAYTDSLVKDYETINLYLGADSTMSTTKPTGTGTIIEKVLSTTEQLVYTASYTIPEDGVVLKDNLYVSNLFFNSISTSRVTYIRTVYTVGGIIVFDVTNSLNNNIAEYELYRQIINHLDVDTPYTAGTIAQLDIYGRVDSGTDSIEFTVGSETKPSGLYRNATIATLSANKIVTNIGLEIMSQQELNDKLIAESLARLPSLTGNAGKFLSTDGTIVAWKDITNTNSLAVYVSKTGNDDNDGTVNSPFLTIMKAVSMFRQKYYSYIVLNIGRGTYDEDVSIDGVTSPLTIRGVLYEETKMSSLVIGYCTAVNLENLKFGKTGNPKHSLQVCNYSMCSLGAGITIIGGHNAYNGLYAAQYGCIAASTATVTIEGTFSGAIASEYHSLVSFPVAGNIVFYNVTSLRMAVSRYCSVLGMGAIINASYVNTGQRFLASDLASISTQGRGLNHIPGNSAGVANAATGGYYS